MPPFEIDLFSYLYLLIISTNIDGFWSIFQGKSQNILFIQWKCILDIWWPINMYYMAKKSKIRENSVTFSKYDLFTVFFACKFFTNIGKLYLKRKDFSCSFQIWSQNWNICSSKKSSEENSNVVFFCVRNHFKRECLGPKLWL